MRTPEPEPLDDDRGPAVGGDDQPAREGAPPGGPRPWLGGLGDDAGHPSAVAEQVDHAHALAERDAGLPRALDERQVERPAAHGKGVRSMAVPGPVGRVVADQQGAVGREDPHPPERPRPVRLHPERTPRRSRIRLPSGERYSPQILSRGKRARSRRTTESPCSARRIAVAAPAGPAPTTTASACMRGPRTPGESRRPPGGTRGHGASGCRGARRAWPGPRAPLACTLAAPRGGRRAGSSGFWTPRVWRARRPPTRAGLAGSRSRRSRAAPARRAGRAALTTASSGRWWRTSEQSATSTEPGRMGGSSASPATTWTSGVPSAARAA